MHENNQTPTDAARLASKIADTAIDAKELENRIAILAIEAGRGPAGLALNVAKTQVGLAIGMLLRAAQDGAPVGSG